MEKMLLIFELLQVCETCMLLWIGIREKSILVAVMMLVQFDKGIYKGVERLRTDVYIVREE